MEIKKQIVNAISQNKLVIFVGSGLSQKFNLPNWNKMVSELVDEIDNPVLKNYLPFLDIPVDVGGMSPIDLLERLKRDHSIVNSYIKRKFNISNGDFSLHKKIFELTGQVITTNYDNAFERATDNKILPTVYTSKHNVSEVNKSNDPYIFKLHGSFSEPDDCIVFQDHYNKLYNENSAAKEKLKSIFIDKTILFVGFGFNDPDINLIFSNLDKAFANNNKHFILTTTPKEFKSFDFLEPIELINNDEIENYIDEFLKIKQESAINISESQTTKLNTKLELINEKLKIAFLYPNPLDISFNDDFDKILNCFESLDVTILKGTLNTKTLSKIDDVDLCIIASKVYKSKLYLEDDNLKSSLFDPQEIWTNIPNEKIPIIFITNEKIEPIPNCPSIYISSFKNQIINKFIYKALKCCELNFNEEEIFVQTNNLVCNNVEKGVSKILSFYGNNKSLDIGKKCISNVIGRIEEQAAIALKIISILKSNKLLNIKASGGTGKTTLVKKVAYELYNRGYFTEGINFKSCESIKTLSDFEEVLIEGFGLNNIVNFKDYLKENFIDQKINVLIILDNFESVVNVLDEVDLFAAIDLLKYSTDFANIVVTSREKISLGDDFEDLYTLTPLITDDAFDLFVKSYGDITNEAEIKILRNDILEDLLNNNPLAIKLVTKSRTRFEHISQLKEQLSKHFFESINEDYTLVFKNNADLNIEKTKSIYQSINYSYKTLNSKESIAFELLNLFPDGISLSNFKKCFQKQSSTNNISDKELRALKDKSLIEDYNGTLQLQPIIRRFAEFQFSKRSKEIRQKYCLDAYLFNCYVLEIIDFIHKKKSFTEALKLYVNYKNNLINVLNYIPYIEVSDKSPVSEKKYLLNFIYDVEQFFINDKQIELFEKLLNNLKSYFSEITNSEKLIDVLFLNKSYFYSEFDLSYKKLNDILSVEKMETRVFNEEDYIEYRYKNIISHIHSMEGYTFQRIQSFINNDNKITNYLVPHFFYLGIPNSISRKQSDFYFYEEELMFNRLNIIEIENYISDLFMDEHLEIMQCTYTLSKVKKLDKNTIQKLVVTNPYTKGLKELMSAFNDDVKENKIRHFENALNHLEHIKYYYLEALFFYCLYLKDVNYVDYKIKLDEGLNKSKLFKYQHLDYLFENIGNSKKKNYIFSYEYYGVQGLENYVEIHNIEWEKVFKARDI